MTNKPLINIYNNKRKLFLFCRDKDGKLFIEEDNSFFPYFYELDKFEGKFKAYTGESLRKVFVSNPSDVPKTRGVNAMEADIIFTRRYLIDKIDKLEKCPIKIAWIDMEVQSDVFPDPKGAKYPISCISVGNSFTRQIKTFFLPNYTTEFEMLDDFINYMKKEQFDLMTGWNLVKFDYPYLFNRIPDFAQKIGYQGHVRYGDGNVLYPAGISIVDYLILYKIIFKGLADYSLDNVLKHEFGEGKKYKKVDFSTLNEEVKLRNIDDVRGMIKIDEKHNIIDHYNEIRLFTKVSWEDFIYNSRAIDMLLLEEGKLKKKVLPMKPVKEEGKKKEKFEQAYREIFEKGRFENVGKYDLAGAYLNAIIDLNLDTANIMKKDNDTIPVNVTDRKTQKVIETYFIKQDSNTLLPAIAKKLLDEKNKLKELKNNTNPESSEYKGIEKKYEAMKALVLSAWGVMGNEHFRIYDVRVASMITSIVRDIIHYVKDELEKRSYSILYLDTDGIICRDNGENITILLNEIVQQWSQERFGKSSSIKFDFEGRFNVVILLAMCRYKGWLRTEQGKIKVETKGIEAKRKDSTIFMKRFQIDLLDKIKNKIPKEEIFEWIEQKMIDIKTIPLNQIAFPCKIGKKLEDYSNTPIFIRALQNSDLTKRVGEPYHYLFIKPEGYETKIVEKEVIMTYDKDGNEKGFKNFTGKRLQTACKIILGAEFINDDEGQKMRTQLIEKELIKLEDVEVQGKAKDVIAFDESNIDKIKDKVDWERMIERNILMKLVTIFEAMKWDIKEVNSNYVGKIEIKPDKETKDEVAEYIEKIKKEENKCEHSVKGSTLGFQPKSEGSSPSVRSKFDKSEFLVKEIDVKKTYEWFLYKHYAHRVPQISYSFGLYRKDILVGVCSFGMPASGFKLSQQPYELNRLVINDNLPKNVLSFFVSQTLKLLPQNTIIVSYADINKGHRGYIYQATNWIYTGQGSSEQNMYLNGKLIHRKNVYNRYGTSSVKKLEEMGFSVKQEKQKGKHRYFYLIGDKKFKREKRKEIIEKYRIFPYPKGDNINYDASYKIKNIKCKRKRENNG